MTTSPWGKLFFCAYSVSRVGISNKNGTAYTGCNGTDTGAVWLFTTERLLRPKGVTGCRELVLRLLFTDWVAVFPIGG